jgi:NAD(P)-dependent dehydrogenase (short-subunit alcohol dehydrogenase family)
LLTTQVGATDQTPIRDLSLADWRSLDEVHNIGCFLLTRAALRIMDGQDAITPTQTPERHPIRGSIVMLTSLASEGAFLGIGNYIAAKHAVKGMVQTAAIENARRGIRVNAVAPSYVSGPMMDQFLEASPEVKKTMLGDLPMGRLVSPDEVADAVAFLASPTSSYVNGHTLVVDGGASLVLSNSPFSGKS